MSASDRCTRTPRPVRMAEVHVTAMTEVHMDGWESEY